ncbi:MAG TPA: phosphonate ABC transporter, permease protein PhnE [Anaerolineales bacterium]|nr:phosphonate ABC transporter, permease protein PhnE [Anaerolineales bacterium]
MSTPKPDRWRALRLTLITLFVALAYVFAYRGSFIASGSPLDPRDLLSPDLWAKGGPLLGDFLTPDLAARDIEPVTLQLPVPVPCGSAENGAPAASGPRLVPSVPCAEPRDKFTVEGFELQPNTELQLRWRLPSGQYFPGQFITTDADGYFSAEFEARPIVATKDGVPGQIEVELQVEVGELKPSQAFFDVLDGVIVTIFMALMATAAAVVVAAPFSFLAAQNVTRRGPVGTAVYYTVRTIFNILRSFEAIVIATLFAFWVDFGPFAGVLALTVVTVASLGKLFSEAIEGIDPGPVEALTATGANRLQVVWFAIVPQIVPNFVSFIIYHWDINVRISTIIGYVGGGGIGYYLAQMINTGQDNKAGTAIWAIVLVVWAMDFISAEVRKRYT